MEWNVGVLRSLDCKTGHPRLAFILIDAHLTTQQLNIATKQPLTIIIIIIECITLLETSQGYYFRRFMCIFWQNYLSIIIIENMLLATVVIGGLH